MLPTEDNVALQYKCCIANPHVIITHSFYVEQPANSSESSASSQARQQVILIHDLS